MKSRKALLLFFTFAIFSIEALSAQKKIISNVISVQLKNIGPILSESEVTGYYLFYQTDRISKKIFSYEIEILDQNLNKLSSHTIEGSKYMSLEDGVFNDKTLMLKLYDAKAQELTFTQYNKEAKEISRKTRKASHLEVMAHTQAPQNDGGQNVTLFPLNKLGFVDYRAEKNKKFGYVIDFYPTQQGAKKWTASCDVKSDVHQFANYIYADENVIISSFAVAKNLVIS